MFLKSRTGHIHTPDDGVRDKSCCAKHTLYTIGKSREKNPAQPNVLCWERGSGK
jgi:hypothetical protein